MNGDLKPCLGSQIQLGHPLAAGLVVCWLMNENGGNKIYDLSGNGNHGTFGATTTSPIWKPGQFGSNISFDGGDYIDCGAGVNLDISVKTISFRLNGTFTNYARLLSAPSGFTNDYQVVLDGTAGRINLTKGTGNNNSKITGIGTFTNNKWYHVVITDGGTVASITFYINGVLTASAVNASSFDIAAGNFLIGKRQDSTNYYTGLLDNVQIWNRVLSANEIAKLYLDPFCMFEEDM